MAKQKQMSLVYYYSIIVVYYLSSEMLKNHTGVFYFRNTSQSVVGFVVLGCSVFPKPDHRLY